MVSNDSTKRPTVFVGSSSEGLHIAKGIQVLLDHVCAVKIWSQGVFGLGEGSLESLVKHLDKFDFAILVMTPDDMTESRGETKQSPRDNVLLELGIFIGGLGRERTFAIYDRSTELKIPSDLAGVTIATYHPHDDGNILASLGAPCTAIEHAIKNLGLRSTRRQNFFLDDLARQQTGPNSDYDVFCSLHPADLPQVIEIAEGLKGKGIRPFILHNRVPGMNWVDVMQDQITAVPYFAAFFGQAGISPWQAQEIRMAIQQHVVRHCTLIPVILHPSPKIWDSVPPFLRQFIAVYCYADDGDPVQKLADVIKPSTAR